LLKVDLYVQITFDGEAIVPSSNRRGIKNVIPGRRVVGERIDMKLPVETFLRIARAKTLSLKFDGIVFNASEKELSALKGFAASIPD
jgi:hypothetical protein